MSKQIEVATLAETFPEVGSLNKLVDTLVIDYSAVAKSCLGRVSGKNYAANQELSGRKVSNDAMEEWYYQVASTMLTLTGACNPSEVVIAMDSKPYWRTAFVEKYYRKENSYWGNFTENSWIIEREGTFTLATWDIQIEQWILKNMTKAVKDELGFDETTDTWPSTWFYFHKSEMPTSELERANEIFGRPVPSSVYAYPAFTDLGLFEKKEVSYPYKHGRSWQWESIISSSEFNETSTTFAHMVSPFVGGKVPISVEYAEADDVIHSVCKMNKAKGLTTAVASVDADLRQLVGTYVGTQFIKLVDGLEMLDTTPAKEDHNFRCKIVGGDNSDKIRGVRKVTIRKKDGVVTNITKPMSVDAGEKWTLQFKHDFVDSVATKLDKVSYHKNATLVDLCLCPIEIQENIESALTDLPLSKAVEVTINDEVRTPSFNEINIGQSEMADIVADSKQLNNEWGVLVGFEQIVVSPVEPTIPEGVAIIETAPKLFKFTGVVQAHPTNKDFPSWSLAEVIANHPQDAIEKWKAMFDPKQFGDLVKQDAENGGWKWWECDITITDNGEVI